MSSSAAYFVYDQLTTDAAPRHATPTADQKFRRWRQWRTNPSESAAAARPI